MIMKHCKYCKKRCVYRIKSPLGIQHAKTTDTMQRFVASVLRQYQDKTISVSYTNFHKAFKLGLLNRYK